MSKKTPYIIFCAANFLWLMAFATFSLSATMPSFVALNFIAFYAILMIFYAIFGLQNEENSDLAKWFFVLCVIAVGLVFRVLSWQIFQTAQMQDFGRAHETYLFLQTYSPLADADSWADYHWLQLYYSRFPGWFPHFLVTRFVYGIFGASVRYMIALNYLLYAASAVLLYATIKRFFSFATAFCAIALFVFNPNLIVWANITSPDPIFMLLFLCLLYFLARFYTEKNRYVFLIFAAVFAALTDFFKPIGLMFFIAFFCVEIYLLICENRPRFTENLKQWAIFAAVFFAVFFTGHALVRAEIQRVFRIETVSSTGKYMAFAWSTDTYGNYDISPVFERFNYLMEQHENYQPAVMAEMNRFARQLFSDANVLSVLRQKARLTFSDEGTLGWVFYSHDEAHSAALHRTLGATLWVGFSVHIFVLMFFAAVGAIAAIFAKQRALLVFLLTTSIGYTLVLLLGVAQARYRLLLYPQFSVLAAIGLVSIVHLFREKRLLDFLKFHGRKIVLPADEIKTKIAPLLHERGIEKVLDFGAGTLFWSNYFANDLSLTVLAADTSYAKIPPQTNNPKITPYPDITSPLMILTKADEPTKSAIFICDVIHHLPPDLWQQLLPQIAQTFNTIIIKDINAAKKFGNFMNKLHDRVINGEKIHNVYPAEITTFLESSGFSVSIESLPKLWYPHFLLIATKK